MKKLNQAGAVSGLLIGLILSIVLLMCSIGFGAWAFSGRQQYKTDVEGQIATAVASAQQQTSTTKDKEFAEKEKDPLKDYTGPAAYGSLSLRYPKTWSAYIDESSNASFPLDGYFNPNFVPGLQSNSSVALRIQVTNTAYAQEIRTFDSNIKAGKIKASAYRPDKVQSVLGLRLEGDIVAGKQGIMVVVPLRDKTLKIWTEASQYSGDFNNTILPNLNFVP